MDNLIYSLQFYFTLCFSAIFFGLYTTLYDFSRNALHNRVQHSDIKEIYNTYYKIIPTVSFNVLISNFLFILSTFNITEYYSYSPEKYYLLLILLKIYIMRYLTDFFFYSIHRLMHTKYFYKFHKIHHEIKAPIGITAFYMHPIDYIFGNLLPIYLPTLIVQADFITIHVWIILSIGNSVIVSHGGFINKSEFHDDHHKYFKYNYGTEIFMDKLFKTKKELTQ